MQRIIKNNQIVDETWHLLPKETSFDELTNCDDYIVPLQLWREHAHALKARDGGLGVQMNAVMGSFASGREATAWVKQFAIDVPLQLNEVNQAFVKAKAFGLDPMNGTMKAIVDQAFKLGGGFQEVEGITLALGQAAQIGTGGFCAFLR